MQNNLHGIYPKTISTHILHTYSTSGKRNIIFKHALKKGRYVSSLQNTCLWSLFSFSLLSYSGQSRKKALTARCEASKTRLPFGRPKSSKSSFLGRFVDETKGPTAQRHCSNPPFLLKKHLVIWGICWGWSTTQLCGDYFVIHYKDSY